MESLPAGPEASSPNPAVVVPTEPRARAANIPIPAIAVTTGGEHSTLALDDATIDSGPATKLAITHGDHRMAMAFAVAALGAEGDTTTRSPSRYTGSI